MLTEKSKSALRLTALDRAAEREGLNLGMTLADARARAPGLRMVHADPAADLALLTRLAEACRRYTPALALHGPDGVDLNVTGCPALFGGEDALLATITRRFDLSMHAAIADTPGLAYAAARFGNGGAIPLGAGASALVDLPISALRIEPDSIQVLRRLGLKRIGQILELPRPSLARRLGEVALHRLDEALGLRAGPLDLKLEVSPFMAERRVFEPIADEPQVRQVIGDLTADLSEILDTHGYGGRRFRLELFRVDGAIKRLTVAASTPMRDAARIAALFAERLAGLNEGLEADFGFDQFRLIATTTDKAASGAYDLLGSAGMSGGADALVELADRLTARIGVPVLRLAPGDAHRPERAVRTVGVGAPVDWSVETPVRFEDVPLRPLRLFTPPQPIETAVAEAPEGPPRRFTWRRVAHTVVRAEGPERLEPEWALEGEDAPVRDYYRLEDEQGRRFWVFRQGRYDAPTDRTAPGEPEPPPSPVWYLHGLFG
ncbi:MAG: DNA polymerase Y family protein [Caulobacteraceae bacterium]